MASINRRVLKSLIKECLVEILSEGLANSASELSESVELHSQETRHKKQPQSLARPKSASLDSKVVKNNNFEVNVRSAVRSLTDNPMLQEILSDTARGTLQTVGRQDPLLGQTSMTENVGGHNPTAGPMIDGDPADLFDGASNWSHLAFSSRKNHLPGQ